jgi:hypothetical protein
MNGADPGSNGPEACCRNLGRETAQARSAGEGGKADHGPGGGTGRNGPYGNHGLPEKSGSRFSRKALRPS